LIQPEVVKPEAVGEEAVGEYRAGDAQCLSPARAHRLTGDGPDPDHCLADGSMLSLIGGVKVRIIEA